ncbi:MAG: riboflavin biosynthesis protein RibF [Betaproteobacteria bacterium]|nr:riboflavin biosynthesis protein RibF [Betaproteobacteria bacterium]
MLISRAAPAPGRELAAAIGNFDGLHVGHRLVLERMLGTAKRRGLASAVVTFEPHPLQLLDPDRAPVRIDDFRSKMDKLAGMGIEHAIVLRFDRQLASLTAADFERLLARQLRIRHITVGADFRYGRGRSGDVGSLQSSGLEAEIVADLAGADGRRISSGLVRELLAGGDFAAAAGLLGTAYCLRGRIGCGQRLGRQLGFPTANLIRRGRPPLEGVYAAWVDLEDGSRHPAALSVGHRPAVGGRQLAIEAHLLDFSADLYGQRISIEPVQLLRPQRDYPDLRQLAEAIGKDVLRCREVLPTAPVKSG